MECHGQFLKIISLTIISLINTHPSLGVYILTGNTQKRGFTMSANEDYIKQIIEERARNEAEKKALIEEFTKTIPLEWTPEDLKEKMMNLLASSYARIAQTINDDDNPAIAYKAAWDVMKVGMGQIAITDNNDPNKEFMDLLKGLQAPEEIDASTQPPDDNK